MNIALRRTETIKFGDFMSGGYKEKAKAKKRQIGAVVKATATSTAVITASKVAIPLVAVAVPAMLLAGKTAMASSGTAIPVNSDVVAIPVGAISDEVKSRIIHSFDPLIDLMVSLSLPIAGVMVTGGALLIMIGQKDMGLKLIMNSALGYVLVQMSPMFIDLLAGVGSAI
jgi:hypothetical protein